MVEGGVMRWETDFRRSLRTFQQDSLVKLRAALGDIPVFLNEEDEIIWT